jgi:hypothetical protein
MIIVPDNLLHFGGQPVRKGNLSVLEFDRRVART